jgi:hypothetical protein
MAEIDPTVPPRHVDLAEVQYRMASLISALKCVRFAAFHTESPFDNGISDQALTLLVDELDRSCDDLEILVMWPRAAGMPAAEARS